MVGPCLTLNLCVCPALMHDSCFSSHLWSIALFGSSVCGLLTMSGFNMMEATKHLSVQTSATMEATKKTGWQTPQTLATMGAAMQASRHLGSKDKRQPVKDDEQREEKMIVGQHYHCAAYYQTGCQAQWTGSHGWWANGVRNGKKQFICEACQLQLLGWVTNPSIDAQRIMAASSSTSSAIPAQIPAPIDPADVPVPMDVDDDL